MKDAKNTKLVLATSILIALLADPNTVVSADIAYVTDDMTLVKAGEGKPVGILQFAGEHGEMTISLEQFDSLYKGMVKQWPVISPVKELVGAEYRAWAGQARVADTKAKADAKAKERAAAKAAKDAEGKAKKDAAEAARKVREDAAKAKLAEKQKVIEDGRAAFEKRKAELAKAAAAAKSPAKTK